MDIFNHPTKDPTKDPNKDPNKDPIKDPTKDDLATISSAFHRYRRSSPLSTSLLASLLASLLTSLLTRCWQPNRPGVNFFDQLEFDHCCYYCRYHRTLSSPIVATFNNGALTFNNAPREGCSSVAFLFYSVAFYMTSLYLYQLTT